MKKLLIIFVFLLSLIIVAGCDDDESPDTWTEPLINFLVTPNNNPNYGEIAQLVWSVSGPYVESVSVVLDGEEISTKMQDTMDLGPITQIIRAEIFVLAGKALPMNRTIIISPKDPVFDSPTLTVNADPPTLPVGGGTTTLSWITQNADTVMYNNTPYGPTGSLDVSLSQDSTFNFLAIGPGGQKTASISVAVETPPPPLTPLELLRNGKWYENETYITIPHKNIFRQQLEISECMADDYFLFGQNLWVELNLGPIACEGVFPNQSLMLEYTFIRDTIFGLGDPRCVEMLNDSILVWNLPGTSTDSIGIQHPTIIEQVFKHTQLYP